VTAEPQLRAFLEEAPDAFIVHDFEGRITDVNRKTCTQSGYSRAELLTMQILDLEQNFDMATAQALWLRAQPGETFSFPGRHRRKDGTFFPVEVHLSVYIQDGVRTMVALIHDVSLRKATEAQKERQTRLYHALSEVNQAIVRMDDQSRLFPLVCRMAVEFGGMKVAWVGLHDEATRSIRAVVSYGAGADELRDVRVSSSMEVPEGRGPSGTAWREQRNVVVNHFLDSPITAPWRTQAERHGWGSVGSFPIMRARRPAAILVVYHEHPDAFDDGVVRLLDEMVRDISFALDNFDREAERHRVLAQLEENEARLRLTLEATGIGVWDWDLRHDVWYATPIYFQMLGDTPDTSGQSHAFWAERVHPDDQTLVSRTLREVREQRLDHFDIRYRLRHANGSYRWVNSIGRAVAFDEKDQASRMLGLQIDITENKQAEEALSLSEEKFSKVFSNLPNPVSITRLADGTFVDVNAAWSRFMGITREEALGRTALALGVWGNPEDRVRLVTELQNAGRVEGFETVVNAQNHRATCLISAETIQMLGETHMVLVLQDITEKKRYDDLIWKQANFDLLTDLPNRYMFYDRLDQGIKKAHRDGDLLGLLFIDLDRFKEVNDTLGHHIGDVLLVETARRIRECVRETDSVARLGGDEFTVAVSQIRDAGYIEKIAQNILKRLAEPFLLDDSQGQVYISASIGITLYPLDAQDVDQMLKNADQAMYAAKNAGRNRFSYFTPALQDKAQYRLKMHNDLRQALGNRQFELHFQPIVDMALGRIVKAEALLRWNHPGEGLVGPAEFVPLAEETGLIMDIGDWVFKEAVRYAKLWKSVSPDLQISVNMSPLQFHNDAHVVQDWLEHLLSLGLSGRSVAIEITESLLLGADTGVTDKLLAFRDAEIQVAIDDFGTGYSSLSYLNKYHIDYLKIDQIFVRNLVQDANSRTLSEAIIAMAHKLGLKVIAEGIETAEQRSLLKAAGCDFGQGYLYSRPVPAIEFEALLLRPVPW
jgi:diguanylate cyclase (GGDEF)-like protein/PAS domain S-box-containing protein